jgi:hypothetical protein
LSQRPGNLVVPASPDDRDARAPMRISHSRGRLPTRLHLPQSSPRMSCYWVSG